MSLKRPQMSMDELSASFSSSVHSSRTPSQSRRSRRSLHGFASSVSSSTSWYEASLPRASAPRTVEIMWGGVTAPGFTLKRKRTGLILVSTVTRETQVATSLKIGSELRLVGGFPVNTLSLQDVKKVMLLAPKPVSLVFVNADDVRLTSVDHATDNDELHPRRKLSSASLASAFACASLQRSLSGPTHGRPDDETASEISTNSVPAFYSTRSESNESKKRKVSKLQVALDRFNRLVNRPVRQASLYFATGKSIVV